MGFLRPRLIPEQPEIPLVPSRSDYDLNPHTRPQERRELAPAAVLLAIVMRETPTILFTQRTEHLPRHAGQVSFPGGRAHSGDLTLVETALRETQEETGIEPAFVSIAGFLDPYETGTGYAILPVVGLLAEGFALVPDANEVADVFEVPLEFLLDSKNRERHSREWQGKRREFYAFTHDGHYIWGATAAILVNFTERLSA
ncbi:MAG: CoA pyrophosphatase [Proteobacteria bacterium]|nr:CoA pyrophosphatase [Pseudomonadota bacterium]